MEAREIFGLQKPRLGGNARPVEFNHDQQRVLETAANQIIPGGGGFPAPSDVGIVGFIGRYITPSGEEPIWFPYAAEDDFKAEVDRLGKDLLQAGPNEQIEILERTEQDSDTFFSQLRDLVYYGYYSRPEVTKAINENVEAGRDYRSPPQPYGYLDVIEDWDQSMLSRVKGSYIHTGDVKHTAVRTPVGEASSAETPPGEPLGAEHPSDPKHPSGPGFSERADRE